MGILKLKKFRITDAEEVYSLFANNKILKNLLLEKKAEDLRLVEEKKWLKRVLNEYKQKKPKGYHLAITLDNKLIGSIGANHFDYKNCKAEIGYWIGEPYWGKGYTPEAINQFSKILFNKFKLNRIESCPFSHNKPSQKVLEKAGFKREGERMQAIKKNGIFLSDILYSKLKWPQ